MTTTFLIIALSITLQLIAAVVAARLARLPGKRAAGLVIFTAVSLMAFRRVIALYDLLNEDMRGGDFLAEVIALIISSLVLAGIIYITHLVASEKKIRELLEESERRYRTLFQQSPDGILVLDAEGKFLDFNEEAHKQLGYSREEFTKMGIADINPEESAELVRKRIADIMHLGKAEFKVRHRTKQGKIRDVHVFAQELVLSGRTVLHTIWRDITAARAAEHARGESELKFRSVFDTANDGILIADVDTGRFTEANKKICEMLQYSREELTGLSIEDIHPRDDLAQVLGEFQQQVRGAKVLAGDLPVMKKDGTVFFADISTTVLTLNNKEYAVGIFRDITKRKQSEEELRELNARLHSLIQAIPDIVVFKDTEGRFLLGNKALEDYTGLTQEQMLGKTNADLLPPELVEACDRSDREVLKDLKSVRIKERGTAKGGGTIFLDTIKAPIFDVRGNLAGLVVISRDISDGR